MNYLAIVTAILAECDHQNSKWGEQNHPDGTGRPGDVSFADAYKAICKANGPGDDTYRDIFAEEVHEVFAETDPLLLKTELVQCAAVIVQWLLAIDRREI
jgi:hypothetical protein